MYITIDELNHMNIDFDLLQVRITSLKSDTFVHAGMEILFSLLFFDRTRN